MKTRNESWIKRGVHLICAANLVLATILPAFAQEPEAHGVVGHEVRSTNTPGGGGELTSQGVTGQQTPWMDIQIGPTVAGSAVTNMVITYYHCKECRDAAKKKREDDKKKREEERKKKEEERKKKRGAKAPDVPTFDPRTHELKDGKVVPKTTKSQDTHQNCPRPEKFECGEHYQWWLENHEHMATVPNVTGHEHCEKPPKFECSEHYRWWLENHKHRTEPAPATPMRDEDYRYDSLDRKIKKMSLAPDRAGWQIVMTGTVVAGEEATASVLDADGSMLTGVVLELPDGTKTRTDERGLGRFKVPNNLDAVTLAIAGTKIVKTAWSWFGTENAKPQPTPLPRPYMPMGVTAKPIIPGQATAIVSPTTSPNPEILIDGRPTNVLASSPTSTIADMPYGLAPGAHALTIRENGRITDIQIIEAVWLKVEAPKTLVRGETASYTVEVIGSDQPVPIRVRNESPTVVKLMDASSTRFLNSCGGSQNKVKIDFMAIGPGSIRVLVDLMTMSPDLNYRR